MGRIRTAASTSRATAPASRPAPFTSRACTAPGTFIWEGINIDSKAERGSLTVQLRDILVDGVNVELPGEVGKHYGGDALQAWNGPHRLRVDGFEARNLHYQGLFLQPNQFGSGPLGPWELRNINLQGHTEGSQYLLWLVGSRSGPGAVDIAVDNVHVRLSPGRSADRTFWDRAADWYDVTFD